MTKIAFASGKGGAGKTSFSLSFFKYLAEFSIFADSDVDAADAFLLIEKKRNNSIPFVSGFKYSIHTALCTKCGACASQCPFGAIKKNGFYYIEPLLCEGCGICEDVCLSQAIDQRSNNCGEIFESKTICNSKMIHARLHPGEDNSGKLVHQVRNLSQKVAVDEKSEYMIIDCPPGIGCSLIASITGVDILVVVIECSHAGINDAQRLMTVARQMSIPMVAVMNKSGINPAIDEKIIRYLEGENICLVGNVQFNEEYVNTLNRNELLIDSEIISSDIKCIYGKIIEKIKGEQNENRSSIN